MPFQNDYLNTDKDLIEIKVPGYRSQQLDVTTLGVSGALNLELESQSEVQVDKLQQNQYIPAKLEFGLMISPAPSPFIKTTVLTLVPRYVIVNQLNSPIVVMQKSQDLK